MPAPNEFDDDRPLMQALQNSSYSGYHGNDGREVDCSDKDIDQALKELSRKSEPIVSEYEERQRYTSPAEERRQEKERVQYMLENMPGKPNVSGT